MSKFKYTNKNNLIVSVDSTTVKTIFKKKLALLTTNSLNKFKNKVFRHKLINYLNWFSFEKQNKFRVDILQVTDSDPHQNKLSYSNNL